MSTVRHEGEPAPEEEAELTTSLEEARREVLDTVESIISASLDKAVKLEIGGDEKKTEEIVKKLNTWDKLEILSEGGDEIPIAVNTLRQQARKLSAGIRDDAKNHELAALVDKLGSLNQVWKGYVEDLKDAESIAAIMESVPYSIRTRSMATGENSTLLTPEAEKELKENEKPRRK